MVSLTNVAESVPPPVTAIATGEVACVTDPFAPCRVMLPYVPDVVLAAVWTVNVACTNPFDGTVTCVDDQPAVAPGTVAQFRAAGTRSEEHTSELQSPCNL